MHKKKNYSCVRATVPEPRTGRLAASAPTKACSTERGRSSSITWLYSSSISLHLGNPRGRNGVTTSPRPSSILPLPGPDRQLKKKRGWGGWEGREWMTEEMRGRGQKRHTVAHLPDNYQQRCLEGPIRRLPRLTYEYRSSWELMPRLPFSGRTNVYINIQNVQYRQVVLVWES